MRLVAIGVGVALAAAALPGAAKADTPAPTMFTVGAGGDLNAMFHLSPRYFPELAQSFQVSAPLSIADISFQVPGVTKVEPAWWTTPEAERHGLEASVFTGTVPVTSSRLRLWKAPVDGDIGLRFDLRNGFSPVAEVTQTTPLELGAWYTFVLPQPLTLEPGTYVATFWIDARSPNLVTVYVAGRESGNHTTAGLNHDGPMISCDYTRSPDGYPEGRAYRTDGSPVPFAVDSFTPPQATFVEHAAKVNECIQVGRFGDIWNEGDLAMRLRGPAAPVVPPAAALAKPTGIKVTPGRGSVTVTWTPNSATGVRHVATAARGALGATRTGSCSAPASRGRCTITGLAPGSRVFVSVRARDGSAASGPTLQVPVRVR